MSTPTPTRSRIRAAVVRPLLLALVASAAPAAGVVASSPASAHPYCGIRWGSLAKTSATHVGGPVTDVRAGRHACFDRLVIDLKGKAPGYTVGYVDTMRADGSGSVIALRGGAKLSVRANAPAYTSSGTPSFVPRNRAEVVNVGGYTTFRQVAWAGSYEGYTTLGVGVRARLPFRVFTLQDATTSRLVVDVAHRW
jgi:hypothetical protein